MFAADKNPGRSGARVCLVGAVLVLVVPMQEVGVAGLSVGVVDGHPFGARLLQVEDACAADHVGPRFSPAVTPTASPNDHSTLTSGIPAPTCYPSGPQPSKCGPSRHRCQRPAELARKRLTLSSWEAGEVVERG